MGAGYVKLVPSCNISTMFKTLHLALHLFSDPWLYDHMVTNYVAIIMFLWTDMELRNKKFTFTEKLDYENFILQNLELYGSLSHSAQVLVD